MQVCLRLVRKAHGDQGVGLGHLDRLQVVGVLGSRLVGGVRHAGDDAFGGVPVLEGLEQAPPVGIVDVEDADAGDAVIQHQFGQDRPLGGVGQGGAEQEVGILRVAQRRRRGGRADEGYPQVGSNFLRHRQRHAARQGPDDGRGALFFDQPPCLQQSLLGVQGGVADDQPHVAAADAAGLVYLIHGQGDHVADLLGGFGKAAREGAEVTDRQRVLFHRRLVTAARGKHDSRAHCQGGQGDDAK